MFNAIRYGMQCRQYVYDVRWTMYVCVFHMWQSFTFAATFGLMPAFLRSIQTHVSLIWHHTVSVACMTVSVVTHLHEWHTCVWCLVCWLAQMSTQFHIICILINGSVCVWRCMCCSCRNNTPTAQPTFNSDTFLQIPNSCALQARQMLKGLTN